MEARASLRFARVSPRRARLVADLVRGQDVDRALQILSFTRKKSAPLIQRLVESAVANAEQAALQDGRSLDVDTLYIREIRVDQGPKIKRWRPRAMGRATRICKPTSHITVVLDRIEE